MSSVSGILGGFSSHGFLKVVSTCWRIERMERIEYNKRMESIEHIERMQSIERMRKDIHSAG